MVLNVLFKLSLSTWDNVLNPFLSTVTMEMYGIHFLVLYAGSQDKRPGKL